MRLHHVYFFCFFFFPHLLQVNFTIEPSTCLRDAGFVSRLLAATVVGYDEILVNMFMFSMRSKGLLKNTQVRSATERTPTAAAASAIPTHLIAC